MNERKFHRINGKLSAILNRAIKAGAGEPDATKAGVIVTRVSATVKRRRVVR